MIAITQMETRGLPPKNFIPPFRLLAVLLLVLFVGEGLIMLALPHLFPGPLRPLQNFADPVLLVAISAPFIWVLIVSPLRNALDREKKWANTLLEHVVDGVVIADKGGRITSINRAAEAMFGYGAGEVVGRDFSILFSEACGSRGKMRGLYGIHETGLEGDGFHVTREDEGERKDKSCFSMEISMSRVRLAGDTVFIAIIRDVTERKALERRLISSEKNATISVVASSIGHELNNSATSMMGYAELLVAEPEDAELSAKAASVFLAQSNSLAAHAANLLAIGKPRAPVFEKVRLGDYLAELTSMLKVSGVLKRFTVVEEHDPAQPPVSGDKGLLEQVFRNLEINAAQAMGNGGTLTVASRAEGEGFVRVVVADTGSGILPEFMPKVFEPFRTTKGDRGGTGLGMYIAKKIVEQHGGTIEVESKVGEGTTVTVALPVVGSGKR